MSKVRYNVFEPFLNECQIFVWEWYIPEQKVRFGIPSLNGLWLDDQANNVKLDTMLERVHPDDIQKVLVGRKSPLYRSDKMFEVDLRLNVAAELTPDGKSSGQYEWYGFRGKTIARDAKGRPTYVRGVAINVDQRYRANGKLLTAKDRLYQKECLKTEYSQGVIQEMEQFIEVLAQNADSFIRGVDYGSRDQRMLMLNGLKEQISHILDLTDRLKQLTGQQDTERDDDIQQIAMWEHMAELQQVLSLSIAKGKKLYFSNLYDNVTIEVNVKLFDLLLESVIKAQLHNTSNGYLTLAYQVAGEELRLSISCTENEIQRDELDLVLTEGGMSLSVCRLLAKRLWGEIEVHQTEGKILQYVITLPLHPMSVNRLVDTMSQNDSGEMLEDGEENVPLDRLVSVLAGVMSEPEHLASQHLFQIQMATNTDMVLKLFEESNPDIVFIDYNLPGSLQIDQLIIQLRQRSQNTPIIVTAQYAARPLHRRIRQDGANYLLTNPLSLRKVNVMIKKYLK